MRTDATRTAASVGDIGTLAQSWRISLQAANRSPNTVSVYTSAIDRFAEFLTDRGMPTSVATIRREHVEAFLAWMAQAYKPASVRNPFTGIQQFFKWATEEGEVAESPMRNMTAPMIPENPPPTLSDDELRALLKACGGTGFEQRRDTAIVSIFLDAGLRLGELAGLKLTEVDFETRTVTVLGKGRRIRTVGLNLKATQAVDRYIRARRAHPQSEQLPWLWLGKKGQMTGSGVRQMLQRRGEQAGIVGLHPHALRHSWAHLWLAGGGRKAT